MKFLNWIDQALLFPFIGSKGSKRLTWSKLLKNNLIEDSAAPDVILQADSMRIVYETQIRRGLGLGFFASFIPGTSFFKARKNYFNTLIELQYATQENLNDANSEQMDFVYRLLTNLSMTPFSSLENLILDYDSIFAPFPGAISDNQKHTLNELFLFFFPFVSDIAKAGLNYKDRTDLVVKSLKNIFQNIINPAKPILNLLLLLNLSLFRLIEIGSKKDSKSSVIRKGLKGLVGGVFFLPLLITTTIMSVIDSFWSLARTLTIKPYQFLVSAVKQTYQTRNKEFIITDTYSWREAKVVNKTAKILQKNELNSALTTEEKLTHNLTRQRDNIYYHGLDLYSSVTTRTTKTFFILF